MSAAEDHKEEQLNFQRCWSEVHARLPHVPEREKQYVHVTGPGDVLAIKEDDTGYWFEKYDKPNIRKIINDDSITYAWYFTLRFGNKGGWYDD